MPTNEITVEYWVRVPGYTTQSTFSLNPDNTSDRLISHGPYPDGTIYWDFGNINAGGELSFKLSPSIVGGWQHFTFVASQSGSFMAIYQNGVLVAQKTGMTPLTRQL